MSLGCAGSETGNGERPREKRPVSVEMRLEAAGDELTIADRDGVAFVVDTALASVERLDFIMPAGEACTGLPTVMRPYAASCGEEGDRIRIDGPWTVDLVSGQFEPVLEGIDVLDGAFASIEVRLAPGLAGTAGVGPGDVLDGATLDVAGHVDRHGVETPFGLTLDLNGVGRFKAPEEAGAVFIGEASDAVHLAFEVARWFSPLGLGACIDAGYVPSQAGALRLERADRQACGDVAHAVRQALTDTGRVRVQAGQPQ